MTFKLLVLCTLLSMTVAGLAADNPDARAIVDKAINAIGGETVLGKHKAVSSKLKGELHSGGNRIPFSGEVTSQGADQEKAAIELDIMGQRISVIQVLNRDRGWVKLADQTMEMDKEKLAETLESAHSSWVATLLPLKDKVFQLEPFGEITVNGKSAVGVRVVHAGRRDVNLFFDKTTWILVKSETRVKDEETGQEVTQESVLTPIEGKDINSAYKLNVMRDGKPFLEAEITDIKLQEKLDDSVFGTP